ncbi:MAG TPA: NAD(P)-binding domain-containing protein [Kofleriaceae bacterium]|jgi:3-hydroxyisobutyrate dehydrogenase
MIAILGTGLLGANFARALIAKGETVHVWNRTFERAKALEADGAKAFANAADAVKGASRTHVVVKDDEAVESTLAAASFAAGSLVVDHTTTSPGGAKTRSARTDITYVHAPVFMGPQNARESTGIMMVSGERARVERVKPMLSAMTGKLVDFGDRVDAAACFKLMGNTFLMGFTAAIGDLIGLGKACGISASDAVGLFEHFNPGAMAPQRGKRMASGEFSPPSWELAMARKDVRLVQAEVDRAHVALVLVPAIAKRMDDMIERGHSHDDWTVIAKDVV